MNQSRIVMLATTVLAQAFSAQSVLAQTEVGTPAAGAATAPAPPAQDGIADIVVTAQRRSESLQKVPLSVTAIGAEALSARGITSLTKLSDSVTPGLVATPYAGAASFPTFSIRGVSAPDPGTGLNEMGVSVYADGVPLGRAVGAGVDLGDIERIEVLRGPQGTLFGRNAEGGAIQFVTKRPSGQLGGRVEASYGNYDAKRVLAHIDLPSFGNISVKLSGLISKHDGYTKNAPLRPGDTVVDHYDLGLYDQKGFRVAALWKPSSNFNAYYTYDFSNTNFSNTYQVRTGGRTPSEPAFCAVPSFAALCATPASIGANIYQNTRQPDADYPDVTNYPLHQPLNRNHIRGHGLTLDWNVSNAIEIKSITGYRTLKETSGNNLGDALAFVQFVPSSFFDGVGPDVPAGTVAASSGTIATAKIKQDQFSQELQFLADIGQVKMTAGLFYFQENVTDTRTTLFSLPFLYLGTPGQLVAVSVPGFPLQVNPVTGGNASQQTFDARADSYAAYAQGTWTPAGLDDRLRLTAGLRFTHDKKRFNRIEFQGAPDNATSTFKASRVDPAFIIAYDVTPDVNVYGKYSSAYRAGGVNIRNKLALSPYEEEVNKTFEVGFKSQFLDRRVRWNVAAFRSRISGTQTSAPNTPADPSSQTTINLPDPVTFTGFESELTISPVRNFTLGANYAYLHTKAPATLLTPTGLQTYTAPYAPKHQLQLTADFNVPLANEMKLMAHVDYNFTSKNYGTPLASIPSFAAAAPQTLHTTNVKLGVDDIAIGGAKVSIAGYARNLFNVAEYNFAYQTGTNDFTVGTPGGAATFIDPRTYGVELRMKF